MNRPSFLKKNFMREQNNCLLAPYNCYFDQGSPDSVRDEGNEKEDGEGQL